MRMFCAICVLALCATFAEAGPVRRGCSGGSCSPPTISHEAPTASACASGTVRERHRTVVRVRHRCR